MMSPFFTTEPRRTRNSCSRPLVRAKRHDLAVGLGAAGQHELAAVRDHVGVDDRHAESLLGLGFADLKRGFALRRIHAE